MFRKDKEVLKNGPDHLAHEEHSVHNASVFVGDCVFGSSHLPVGQFACSRLHRYVCCGWSLLHRAAFVELLGGTNWAKQIIKSFAVVIWVASVSVAELRRGNRIMAAVFLAVATIFLIFAMRGIMSFRSPRFLLKGRKGSVTQN